jgi:hypothetical protein
VPATAIQLGDDKGIEVKLVGQEDEGGAAQRIEIADAA